MSGTMKNWTPPGIEPQRELRWLRRGLIAAVLWAVVLYFWLYTAAYQLLFSYVNGKKIPVPNAQMPPFRELLRLPMLGFAVAAAAMAILILLHYVYYSQGSHGMYLMRRLPDKGLIHRQCWTMPLLGLAVLAAAALVTAALAYFFYMYFTPVGAMPTLSMG